MKKMMICLLGVWVLTGCKKELTIKVKENIVVEYGVKVDATKLYDRNETSKDAKFQKVEGLDVMKVGSQKVELVFLADEASIKETINVLVKDTKKPTIVFHKNTITIRAGKKYNLAENIKEVTDPIDGKLAYSKTSIQKNGYYIDKGTFDVNKVGTYDINVIAFDKNANKTQAVYKIIVIKAQTAQKDVSENKNANEVSVEKNSSTQNSKGKDSKDTASSSNSSTTKKPNQSTAGSKKPENPSKNKPPTKNEIIMDLGNTGWKGDGDELEARAYAAAEDPNSKWFNHGFKMWTIDRNGTIWTVEFY